MSSSSELNPSMDEVKEIITLRSGRELKQPLPKATEEGQEAKEDELEDVVTQETAVKNSTSLPFLQALKAKKRPSTRLKY